MMCLSLFSDLLVEGSNHTLSYPTQLAQESLQCSSLLLPRNVDSSLEKVHLHSRAQPAHTNKKKVLFGKGLLKLQITHYKRRLGWEGRSLHKELK